MSAVTTLPQAHNARSTIAACVRAHLGVRNMSDSELARKIGTTQSQISRRTNERVPFDVDELGKIADALGISVVELIQMPTPQMVGGGSAFVGVTQIRPRTVGRTGLDPVTDGSWVAPVTPIRAGVA